MKRRKQKPFVLEMCIETLVYAISGGQESLRQSWSTYYGNTDFVILVVDSSDRDRLSVTKEEFYRMLAHDVSSGELRGCCHVRIRENSQPINIL